MVGEHTVMDIELLDYEIPLCEYVFEYLRVSQALETGLERVESG